MTTTALAINPRDNLQLYFREVRAVDLLSPREELELAKRWHDDHDVDAARRLVMANLRFVIDVAMEYRKYGFPLSDLVQEGNVGLMRAVKRFDPYKGFKLITYAVWWIRAHIQEYILKMWSVVKAGTTRLQRRLFTMLQSKQSKLKRAMDKRDQLEALAEDLGTTAERIESINQRFLSRDVSLDTPLYDDSGKTMLDTVMAEAPTQEDALADRQSHGLVTEHLYKAIETLDDRDRYIVTHRMLAEEPQTLQEIGDRFGVSKERARQLEVKIRKTLRASLSEAGIDVVYP